MVKVIINADDLGISHEVNTEIAEAISSGYISSATILANSRYWDEIHAIVSKYPNVSLGVHLNLTEGKALTDSSTFKKLGVVDNENNFTKIIRELDLSDEDLKEAVFDEFEAQLYKVKYIESIPVSHIDGHHHIHSVYEFHDILIRLLDKYQIYKVRNRYNYPQGSGRTLMKKIIFGGGIASDYLYGSINSVSKKYSSNVIKRLLQHLENEIWRNNICKVAKFPTYFDSYEHFINLLVRGCHIKRNSIIELMCHPGHENYSNEYLMIKEKKLLSLLPDIDLISYNNI